MGPEEALAAHKVVYFGRDIGDFIELALLRRAITDATVERALAGRGMKDAEVKEILKPFELEAVRLEPGKESRLNGAAIYIFALAMVISLYTTLLMYGIAVMRSVIEEKSSRLVEVLLASVKIGRASCRERV